MPATASYDRYFAVDTSYVRFGDNYLCATAGLSIDQAIDHKIGLRKGEQVTMFSMPRLIFLAKLDSKPERYGWMEAIDAVVRYKERDPNLRYGIVVDSDLGSIPKMNAGEESIFADYFLPEKLSLIYASADIGKDTLINKLMSNRPGR